MTTDELDFIVQTGEIVTHDDRLCQIVDADLPMVKVCYQNQKEEWVESGDIVRDVCKRCWGTKEIETQTMAGFDIEPCPDCRREDH